MIKLILGIVCLSMRRLDSGDCVSQHEKTEFHGLSQHEKNWIAGIVCHNMRRLDSRDCLYQYKKKLIKSISLPQYEKNWIVGIACLYTKRMDNIRIVCFNMRRLDSADWMQQLLVVNEQRGQSIIMSLSTQSKTRH